MTPRLVLAFPDYARLAPLAVGDVRPEGIDLDWVRAPRNDVLARILADPALDGGEHSLAQHLYRTAAGDRSFVAVPTFPLRNFCARDIYVRKGSDLRALADLAGKRVGMYAWTASGSVWCRHLLRWAGVAADRVRWTIGPVEEPAPAAAPPLPSQVAAAPGGASLVDLLVDGALDAVISPLRPAGFHMTEGPLVRLLGDFRPVEQAYFRETGCFPPQHLVILRRAALARAPDALPALQAMFEEGERRFVENQRLFPYASPWLDAEIDETDLTLGRDYHAHGFARNRHALDAFAREAHRLGLVERVVAPEEMFADYLAAKV
jgi:4,5-dihydroxyphthalate decarboxylase